ncbi:MAG: ATP-binding protein [Hyphomicrobiaceae bacterium]|nr:MAG: ATP-binding protein [Hyphomicrobiaceae bacterium]
MKTHLQKRHSVKKTPAKESWAPSIGLAQWTSHAIDGRPVDGSRSFVCPELHTALASEVDAHSASRVESTEDLIGLFGPLLKETLPVTHNMDNLAQHPTEAIVRAMQMLELSPKDAFVLRDAEFVNLTKVKSNEFRRLATEPLPSMPGVVHDRYVGATLGLNLYEYDGRKFVIIYDYVIFGYYTYFVIVCHQKDHKALYKAARKLLRIKKDYDLTEPVLQDGQLESIVAYIDTFLHNRTRLSEEFKIVTNRGLLLEGPPGTGKTKTARFIKEKYSNDGFNVGVVTGSQIQQAFSNNSLDALFEHHDIVILDDVDVAFFDRRQNGNMACALLASMDSVNSRKRGSIRVFTTNEEAATIDPAFLRPGRIDRRIYFPKPDAALRMKYVKSWTSPMLADADKIAIVEFTDGCNFAEIEYLRSILVTHYIDTGEIEVQKAFDLYDQYTSIDDASKNDGGVGFGVHREEKLASTLGDRYR